jgi:hypothetical protein
VTIEELEHLAKETLEPLGVRVNKVTSGPDPEFPSVEFNRIGSGRYYASPSFLALTKEEARFGMLDAIAPNHPIKVVDAILRIFLIFPIIILGFSLVLGRITGDIYALLLLALIVAYINEFIKGRKEKARRMEENIARSGDPISARTYLEKRYGEFRTHGTYSSLQKNPFHPIQNYINFGKDERIKAILNSDLSHPAEFPASVLSQEEVFRICRETLDSAGVRVNEIRFRIVDKAQDAPIVRLRSYHLILSPRVLLLTEAELKFGLLFHGLAVTPIHKYQEHVAPTGFGLSLLTVLGMNWYFSNQLSLGMSLMDYRTYMALAVLIGSVAFASALENRAAARHLERIVDMTRDPIAARTYLIWEFGSAWRGQKSYVQTLHPIQRYVRYGKDERLKAILRSDLTHPLGSDSDR